MPEPATPDGDAEEPVAGAATGPTGDDTEPSSVGDDEEPSGDDPDREVVDLDDVGELDTLSSAMDADADGPEPRRHWLRYPGLVGALAVVALVILVPCGGGVLFLSGAFADQGRFGSAPDACGRFGARQVQQAYGEGLYRADHTGARDESSCTYRGGAASGRSIVVRFSLTRYGTKGPLSAARMAHAGLNTAVTDEMQDGGESRGALAGTGEEAVLLRQSTGVAVFSRVSNLVVRLDITGDDPGLESNTVAAARQAVGALR